MDRSTPLAALGFALALPAPHEPAEVIVRLRAPLRSTELGATGLEEFERACADLAVASLRPLCPPRVAPRAAPDAFRALGLDRIVRVGLGPDGDAVRSLARLRDCRDVESADAAGRAHAAKNPDDPLFPSQWGLQNDKIAAPRAWNDLTDATGVPIAVFDTGADQQHTDFRDNRWINPGEVEGNGADDDGNGYVDDRFGWDFVNRDGDPDDDDGHGTQVSGVLGAVGDNGLLITGVCWTAEVMSLKVLDDTATGTFADIAEALIYAADNGALVANMSLVSTVDDATLRAAVDYAAAADVVSVGAAGNDGDAVLQYPAAYPAVLGVIATTETDARWSSSSHGDWCDLAAPGTNILSLKNGGGTVTENGTSFAAPFVAGVAALVRKINPDLDEEAARLVIAHSSEDLGTPGFDPEFGWGRLNADLALERARMLLSSAPVVAGGGSVDLLLESAKEAGFLHVLLPTTQGRVPGIALSDWFPADLRVFPLNEDWLMYFVLGHPVNGVFDGFLGTLDPVGQATATFQVPPHYFDATDVDFAFVTFDPADLSGIASVSNPCRVRVQ